MAETTLQPVDGACLCGAIRFRVTPPTLFCGHCHCTMCQRNHGSAYVTWFGVERAQLEVVEGEALLTRYASSAEGTRSFCSRCGTSLFCEIAKEGDHVDIPLVNMLGPLDRAPEFHCHFDAHREWAAVDDGLPRLAGESGLEPIRD